MTGAPAPAATLDEALPLLREHHARFLAPLGDAEALLAARRPDDAARQAQAAAGTAWLAHAGIHASPRLEALIRALSAGGPTWRPNRRSTGAGTVVHILSQAYRTGGHTRWSERIIRADVGRRHSVILTAQGNLPIPEPLAAAVAGSGGRIVHLAPGPLAARTARLRELVGGADVVVANLHPNDISALAALADPRTRPPVLLLNHADHTFWAGVSAADLVVDFRDAGAALGRRRRGVVAARSAVLPLPLDPPPAAAAPETSRRDLRAALGLRPEDLFLLSAGSAWKFDPWGRRGLPAFPEVLAPVVLADPRIRLLVLGPQPVGPWAEAARLTGGRLRAAGTRTDYADLVAAADLYLDPFPMGSLYSLLEPGIGGVPGISWSQWRAEAAVLLANAPGLDAVPHEAQDREGYERLLAGLLDDAAERRHLGEALRASIGARHTGPGWLAAWDDLVARAPAARAASIDAPWTGEPGLEEPSTDLLARGLAWIPERTPPMPDRVVIHLPLARG